METIKPELVCPANNLLSLKTAVDNGADVIYIRLNNMASMPELAYLSFDMVSIIAGVYYAHQQGKKVLLTIDAYVQAGELSQWYKVIDQAVTLKVDGVILSDVGLLDYAQKTHPKLKLYFSVQGSASNYESISLMCDLFNIQRISLPNILTIKQIEHIAKNTTTEIEVCGFGSPCLMAEGKCLLSSYTTGVSSNTASICSSIQHAHESQSQHLENRASLCKSCFCASPNTNSTVDSPVGLNVIMALPSLIQMGVASIKVDGRQYNNAYLARIIKVLRCAIDLAATQPTDFVVKDDWQQILKQPFETEFSRVSA